MKPFKRIWHLSCNPPAALKYSDGEFNAKTTGSNREDMSFKYSCQDNYCLSSGAKTFFLADVLIEQGPSQELRGAALCRGVVGL